MNTQHLLFFNNNNNKSKTRINKEGFVMSHTKWNDKAASLLF